VEDAIRAVFGAQETSFVWKLICTRKNCL